MSDCVYPSCGLRREWAMSTRRSRSWAGPGLGLGGIRLRARVGRRAGGRAASEGPRGGRGASRPTTVPHPPTSHQPHQPQANPDQPNEPNPERGEAIRVVGEGAARSPLFSPNPPPPTTQAKDEDRREGRDGREGRVCTDICIEFLGSDEQPTRLAPEVGKARRPLVWASRAEPQPHTQPIHLASLSASPAPEREQASRQTDEAASLPSQPGRTNEAELPRDAPGEGHLWELRLKDVPRLGRHTTHPPTHERERGGEFSGGEGRSVPPLLTLLPQIGRGWAG